jgi:uncharacterized membrane protein YqjE
MTSMKHLRHLGASVLALGRIRLELFALELQDERDRLAWLLFWAVLAAWTLGLALVLAVALMTVWLWEGHRLQALGAGCVLMVAVAIGAIWQLRQRLSQPQALFETSLAELRRDEAALKGAAALVPDEAAAEQPIREPPTGRGP